MIFDSNLQIRYFLQQEVAMAIRVFSVLVMVVTIGFHHITQLGMLGTSASVLTF